MSDFFLADDLSGALDAAAAFHHAGQRVTIALSLDAWPAGARAGEVVAFTTETRNSTPAAAMEAVTRAIAHGHARGSRLVYKKIDSTLRGPVAAELAALEAALPATRILFTPANPAVGRTVRAGILRVHGVPLAETEFGRDPVMPVRESEIRRLLGDAASPRVTIADAETEQDLVAAVAGIAAAGEPWVAVGSGALARPVAANRCRERAPADRWVAEAAIAGPMLFVCGSAHPVNRLQAARLEREHGVATHSVSITDRAGAVAAAAADIAKSGAATLMIQDTRADSRAALETITKAAGEVIARTQARRIFATGGETAFALCRALEISELTFSAELEPGLSLSRAQTRAGEILFAIKPGAFGSEETWERAWRAVQSDS
jgi:uncharacterized protein YgbK (DUF1537 family)